MDKLYAVIYALCPYVHTKHRMNCIIRGFLYPIACNRLLKGFPGVIILIWPSQYPWIRVHVLIVDVLSFMCTMRVVRAHDQPSVSPMIQRWALTLTTSTWVSPLTYYVKYWIFTDPSSWTPRGTSALESNSTLQIAPRITVRTVEATFLKYDPKIEATLQVTLKEAFESLMPS